jgi:hypothetical protein
MTFEVRKGGTRGACANLHTPERKSTLGLGLLLHSRACARLVFGGVAKLKNMAAKLL